MPRKPITDMTAWPSISLEGNLIAPAQVALIAEPKDDEATRQSYRIRKGLSIRDEVPMAFRVGQSHYDAFSRLQNPSTEATRRFIKDFLAETLGYDDLSPAALPISFLAGGRVPVVVVPPDEEKLDRRSPTLSTERSCSPAFALQDFLNDQEGCLWGLVTNGTVIRLMRDNASLTRPAYIEANLAQIFTNEDAASFSVLWALFHRTRFGKAESPVTDCELERWRDAGAREGIVARERLSEQVQLALKILGTGFLEGNPELANRIQSGDVNLTDWFNELLRLVYRLIFLMVAEDRNLLHAPKATLRARKLYMEGYSLTALRAHCMRAANWDRHHDRYEGVKVVFGALETGLEALALPALGGLFAADKLPNLRAARLRNRAFMEALYRLSWIADSGGTVPVNWRAMKTEELGSVYESLLELQPQLADDGHSFVFASDAAEKRGNQRKTTGSYYTPDSLVQALLDSALEPVLHRTEAESADPAFALLKLAVIDPACGSGHFLLGAANRIATRVARIRANGMPSLEDFRHALRDVVRYCIHGVDRNPMAVELTKVALWIETVDPGLPLGFFDAQIRCGDSLLGVFDLKVLDQGIPDAAYKPLTGDDKDVAKHYRKANESTKKGQVELDLFGGKTHIPAQKPLVANFAGFRALPEETVDQIESKEKRFQAIRESSEFVRVRTAADLYISAFLLPKLQAMKEAAERQIPTTEDVWAVLNGVKISSVMVQAASRASKAAAFHWPLEFPDVMERGGFDVVLGNPPWEVMQLSDKEYFATRNPDIAALTGVARKRAIEELEKSDPAAYLDFVISKRIFEAGNEFARESGRFELTARGKVNTYALFAELFANITRNRAGVIVQTGIATDATTAPFFSALVENKRLARLVDFENREGLFPDVDSRMKFCLLTIGTNEEQAYFAFFLTDPSQLAEPERNFTLSPETIAKLNPNTKTAPVFRSRADAELTAKIYSKVPILIEEGKGQKGNPWGIEFRQGLFNMTSDSHLFRTAAQLEEAGFAREATDWVKGTDRFVPLYEAKMIHQFDHRWASYDEAGENSFDVDLTQKKNPDFEPMPRYWVAKKEVDERLEAKGWDRRWLMGWRDITNATNERTVIMSMTSRTAVGHTMPLMFLNPSPNLWLGLLANLNSLTLDYCARQSVGGTHLTYGYLKQFPIFSPEFYSERLISFLIPRVLELTYTSHSLTPFARELGYNGPPFAWDEERRSLLRAELDSFYAKAYGLNREELLFVLDLAEVKGPNYPSETFRVLKEKEIRQYGEYRTRRLVLKAWDRMEADGTFAALGLTVPSGNSRNAPTPIRSRPLSEIPDGAWARTIQLQDAGPVLTALLKAIDRPMPTNTLRMAAAFVLEPQLLPPLLSDSHQSAEWLRLIGPDAEPRSGNLMDFVARTNQAWGEALRGHRGHNRLIEDLAASTWAPGPGLERFDTSGWPDGRALFVLEALKGIDLQAAATSLPQEIQDWIAYARTA